MENELTTSKKNTFRLPFAETAIELSGDFDSGNLNSASINIERNELQLTFGKDKELKPSSKTWFYFSVQADQQLEALKLCLLKVNTLSVAAKIFDMYRPVVKEQGGQWQRLRVPVEFESQEDGDINMRMTISLKAGKKVFVALTYPWSFKENEDYVETLENRLSKRKDLYFNRETLILSRQGRPLHLLAISGPDTYNYAPEKHIDNLFPKRDAEQHFRQIKKPLILITARVHPGQVGASHALIGMIDWLIGNHVQAARLRNEFYFLIVPMLNPDGVWHGNNRMDSLGQNLNRFYHLPDLDLQPSCYAIKSLLEYTRRQIYAFFDLHGHANKKSCFIFGNYIPNARLQTENVLFAKHLSTICEHLSFKHCNFSKKQMSSKDKNEQLSKEGCARVVVHRWTNSPYCYTLETGLYKDVRTDEKGILRFGEKFYDPPLYQDLGKKILISFAAILNKDKSLQEMRRFCAEYVARLDKPVKKERVQPPKSLKTIGSVSPDTEADQKGASLEVIEVAISKTRETRGEEVRGVLRKNKGVLMNLREDDDDE